MITSTLRKEKIRSIEQINKGETYLISSPSQDSILVKITDRKDQSISAQPLNESILPRIFNWNTDFVFGDSELYSVD